MSRSIATRPETVDSNELHNICNAEAGRLLIGKAGGYYSFFLFSGGRLTCIKALCEDSRADEIIIARIMNIKKELGAAFLRISEDTEAFIKLSNIPERYMPVKQGDLIPVRIISEDQKGKRISVTAKIGKKLIPEGWEHKSAYTVLAKKDNPLKSYILKSFAPEDFAKIITGDAEVFSLLKDEEIYGCRAELYTDEKLSLSKLYSLKTRISEALSQKVYLKSGAYLVINRTEALTVIDVNSGKNTPSKKTDRNEIIFDINNEAAKEIAIQLKLRNISGMILVDFINMEPEDDARRLIEAMEEYVSGDKVTVKVIDITPLGIMELTRQKTDKPLEEIKDILSDYLN
ncbi:MAG: ribonuclease E/G [Lachnospiraceae bacterium]|nr:ribonuclease E/G [Lachnospiraceae bacterium]